MARARGGAGSGWPAATAILGAAFVIALVLAIVFAVRAGAAGGEVERLRGESDRYFNSADEANSDVQALREKTDGQSLVKYLYDQNLALRGIIDSENVTDDELQRVREDLGVNNTSMVAAMRDLQRAQDDAKRQMQETRDSMDDLQRQIGLLQQEKGAIADEYTKAREALEAELNAEKARQNEERAQHEQQLAAMEQRMQQTRNELNQRIREASDALSLSEKQKGELQELVEQIKGEISQRPGSETATLAPDGHIISVEPDRNLVYIDLTRADRLRPGMTFEIVDQNRVIVPDRFNEVRGKATLEVVNVGESGSTGRVVRQEPGATVHSGDQIINIAYDPDAIYEFYVYGEFDLDNSGTGSTSDAETIKAMIRRTGAKVGDSLGYQTDFVVLGVQPESPVAPPEDAPLYEFEQYQFARRKFDEFEAVKARAGELGIPILNQNSFRRLYGDYTR